MQLRQTVLFDSIDVKRSFNEYQATTFGEALECMKKSREIFSNNIAQAFGEIHKQNTRYLSSILFKFFENPKDYYDNQPVQWYWAEFYKRLY